MQVVTDTDGTQTSYQNHQLKAKAEVENILAKMHPDDMRAKALRAKLAAIDKSLG